MLHPPLPSPGIRPGRAEHGRERRPHADADHDADDDAAHADAQRDAEHQTRGLPHDPAERIVREDSPLIFSIPHTGDTTTPGARRQQFPAFASGVHTVRTWSPHGSDMRKGPVSRPLPPIRDQVSRGCPSCGRGCTGGGDPDSRPGLPPYSRSDVDEITAASSPPTSAEPKLTGRESSALPPHGVTLERGGARQLTNGPRARVPTVGWHPEHPRRAAQQVHHRLRRVAVQALLRHAPSRPRPHSRAQTPADAIRLSRRRASASRRRGSSRPRRPFCHLEFVCLSASVLRGEMTIPVANRAHNPSTMTRWLRLRPRPSASPPGPPAGQIRRPCRPPSPRPAHGPRDPPWSRSARRSGRRSSAPR